MKTKLRVGVFSFDFALTRSDLPAGNGNMGSLGFLADALEQVGEVYYLTFAEADAEDRPLHYWRDAGSLNLDLLIVNTLSDPYKGMIPEMRAVTGARKVYFHTSDGAFNDDADRVISWTPGYGRPEHVYLPHLYPSIDIDYESKEGIVLLLHPGRSPEDSWLDPFRNVFEDRVIHIPRVDDLTLPLVSPVSMGEVVWQGDLGIHSWLEYIAQFRFVVDLFPSPVCVSLTDAVYAGCYPIHHHTINRATGFPHIGYQYHEDDPPERVSDEIAWCLDNWDYLRPDAQAGAEYIEARTALSYRKLGQILRLDGLV